MRNKKWDILTHPSNICESYSRALDQGCLVPVPLDRLEAVVPVAGDALVDGDEHHVQAVVEALVQGLHHVGQHRGVFAARSANADLA